MGVAKMIPMKKMARDRHLLSGCAGDRRRTVGKFLIGTFNARARKFRASGQPAVPFPAMGLALGPIRKCCSFSMSMGGDREWFAAAHLPCHSAGAHHAVGLPYDLGGIRSLSPAAASAERRAVDRFRSERYAAPLLCSSKPWATQCGNFGCIIQPRVVEHCEVSV